MPVFRRAEISFAKTRELGLELSGRKGENTLLKHRHLLERKQLPALESLQLNGVTHTFYREKEDSHFTLGPINLDVKAGELVFIIGGNGSGKTTLAKLITGLYAPEQGHLQLNGNPVGENLDEYRQYFTAIFSEFFIFEQLMGLTQSNLDEKARDYLAKLRLDHKVTITNGQLSTTELSTGQRKRLALLTAYLEDRPILLFDEWAADQDPEFKNVFYLELLPELKKRGKTIFVISHDDRYFHVGDRVIKLASGQLEYEEKILVGS